MPRLLLLIALLLLLPAAAQAQSDDLNALTDSFDQLVPALLETNGIAGASLALIHDGAPVWSSGYGVADKQTPIPVTADTVFSVELISKSVTAWEILRLVEAGQIDLDAPVNSSLTGWQVPAVGRNDPDQVTVRRLLSHTAGLSVDGYRGYDTDTTDLPALTDLLDGKASGAQPVRVIISPGARFMYSGGGYEILQLLIEQITGESYADRIQADVFDNLGMDHSYPNWSAQIGDRLATSYTAAGAVDSTLLHADLAAGGLFTSANDLARFFTAGLSARLADAGERRADAHARRRHRRSVWFRQLPVQPRRRDAGRLARRDRRRAAVDLLPAAGERRRADHSDQQRQGQRHLPRGRLRVGCVAARRSDQAVRAVLRRAFRHSPDAQSVCKITTSLEPASAGLV